MFEKIKTFITNHKKKIKILGKTLITGGAELIKVANPLTAAPIEMLKDIFPYLSEIQLKQILGGLIKSENEEMRINELYTYSQNAENKLILYRLVEQALNSSSSKSLVILGIMLSDCMKEGKDPTHIDIIVMNALKTASDYEIKYLKEIYEQYVDDKYIDEKKLQDSECAKEYMKTIEWGYNNRVIGKVYHRWYEDIKYNVTGEFLVIDDCTEKLMYYVYKAKQVLEYGSI